MKHQTLTTALAYAFTLLLCAVSSAQAAPGTLSQSPLFLQTAVKPNVFFLNDNSGSMLWELMTPDYAISGLLTSQTDIDPSEITESDKFAVNPNTPDFIHHDGCADDLNNDGIIDGENTLRQYQYLLQTDTGLAETCNTVAEEEWRARLSDYNALYYDPTREYKPWAGVDKDGNPFQDAVVTAARLDPYDPTSATINLTDNTAILYLGSRATYYGTNAWKDWCASIGRAIDDCKGWRFYTWTDANSDKIIDANELEVHWVNDPSDSLYNPTNFANWFTYHRKREYAAKYALSIAITEAPNVRLGYGTINDVSNNIRIDDQESETTIDNVTVTHQELVLSKLFNTTSVGGTALRSNLKAVGDYYETGNFFGTDGPSPILGLAEGGACQSNNTILMTDGFYNGSSPGLGNVDGDKGKPFADAYANTLADVAMEYYANDLAPTLPNDLTGSAKDPATHQHMNTYTVAFGLAGTLDPDTVDIYADDFVWPDPKTDDPNDRFAITQTRIDDLFHAAVNGHGNFFSASDPDELVQALTSSIGDISDTVYSQNSVTTSSFIVADNSLLFSSRFSPTDWSGELTAMGINNDGTINTTPVWNAAEKLAGNNNRTIFTYSNNTGVPFQWDSINAALQSELIAGSIATDIGPARLQYLRGLSNSDINTTFNSNFTFRERNLLLGDIINSTPIYVAKPASLYPDRDPFGTADDRYFNFWDSNKNRTPMIYVGANDGMLHGFRASDGKELMAYVPATTFPNLSQLTTPAYEHLYYVNQTPTVGDAYFAPKNIGASSWHTVLVGSLGAGGPGLFALNVTDPDNDFSETNANAASVVLWELNASNDNDLGYTLSQPVIALTEEGRWAAITGNGYNSDTGVASLFIIYLDADPSDGWQEGDDYRKISTGVGSNADKNGLSSPTAIDTNGDGYVDRFYAGDLKGNLWAFSVTGDPSTWGVAYENASSAPQPLFQATNASGDIQPITVKPSVIRHPDQPTIVSTDPNVQTYPNLLIMFGTGQYLTQDDLTTTQTQTFYGIWDKGQAYDQSNSALNRTNNLIGQTIDEGTDVSLGVNARTTTNTNVPYGDSNDRHRFGWYIDLNAPFAATGERVVSNAFVINDIVFFTTFTPNSDSCGSGGDSWFMFVNATNGGYPTRPVIDINNDRTVDVEHDLVTLSGDATSASGLKYEGQFIGTPTVQITNMGENGSNTTASGLIQGGSETLDLGENVFGKRISWRELRDE